MKRLLPEKLKQWAVDTGKIWKDTALNFTSSNPFQLAGYTAYIATFSIAPILILIIAVFGYIIGDEIIRYKLFNELDVLIGHDSVDLLERAIDNYEISEKKGIGTVVGIALFLVSATTLFGIIQNSINEIWRIKVKSNLRMSIIKLLKDRIMSFGVILSLGFLLLISLVVDASIAFLKDILVMYLSPDFLFIAQILNLIISLGIIAVIFTLIYRYLPDVKVYWSAAWFAGIFTAILFSVGKIAIGLIIGGNKMGAVYGAVSAFIAILGWIYYASLIFYLGVELSRRYSLYYYHDNTPRNYAVPFKVTTLEDEGGPDQKEKVKD